MLVTAHPDPHDVDMNQPVSPGRDLLVSMLVSLGICNQLKGRMVNTLVGGNVSVVSAVRCLPPNAETHKIRQSHIRACIPWLGRQIATIKPKVIVGLGTVAMSALTGVPVSRCRVTRGTGVLKESPIPGVSMMFTISPEYILHRDTPRSRGQLRQALAAAWQVCLNHLHKETE